MSTETHFTPEQIRKLIQDQKDRLFYLEQRRARLGFSTPPEVLTEIDDITEQLSDLESRLQAIERPQMVGESPMITQDMAPQLQQMDTKLDALLSGQADLRQSLLARYETGEQTIVTTITERLAQSQMTTLLTILDALEANRLSDAEMLQALNAVQETLTALRQQSVSLPGQETVAKAIDDPAFDVTHKLKISLPIIPLLLEYEGELELGSGVNLKTAWDRLKAKVQR